MNLFKKSNNKVILENGKILSLSSLDIKVNGYNNEIVITNGFNKKIFKNIAVTINGNGNKITLPSNTNYKNFRLSIYNDNVEVKLPVSSEFTNVNISMENGENQQLIMGDGTTIRGATIKMLESTKLLIGKDCMFARDIEIQTSDFHAIFDKDSKELLNCSNGNSMIIGDNCWIANSVAFLKNASIANNTIVGNSAVVTKKFTEENIVIAGNPAKIIKRNVGWSRERPHLYK